MVGLFVVLDLNSLLRLACFSESSNISFQAALTD